MIEIDNGTKYIIKCIINSCITLKINYCNQNILSFLKEKIKYRRMNDDYNHNERFCSILTFSWLTKLHPLLLCAI